MLKNLKNFCVLFISIVSMALVLNACQTTTTEKFNSTDNYWANMQERLLALQEVNLRGNLSINHQGERFGAYFNYKKQNQNWSLVLTSSFGIEIASLSVTPEQALLNYSSRTFRASNAQELFEQVLNISLPIDDFPKIMLAIALDQNSILAPQGFVVQSRVQNFFINYINYNTQRPIAVPSQFEIVGEQDRIDVKVTNVVTLR